MLAMIRLAVVSALFLVVTPVWSATVEDVKANFESKIGVVVERINKSPVPSLWEIYTQGSLIYVDEKVDFLLSGPIVSTSTRENLTEKRLLELATPAWKDLPFKDAIKTVYGNGQYQVAIFSDAKCTYCRLVERHLKNIGNVTVYTFLMTALDSQAMAQSIVCASNPAHAWSELVHNSQTPAPQSCNNASVERNTRLAMQLKIRGTPSCFSRMDNGSRVLFLSQS